MWVTFENTYLINYRCKSDGIPLEEAREQIPDGEEQQEDNANGVEDVVPTRERVLEYTECLDGHALARYSNLLQRKFSPPYTPLLYY